VNSHLYQFVYQHLPSKLIYIYIYKYYSKTDYFIPHTYFDSFFVTIIEHTATRLRPGRSVFRMSARIRDFHLLRNVKTVFELHLSSYPMGAVALLGGKWLRSETDYSTPSSAQVRQWTFTSTPLICLHGVDTYYLVFCLTTEYASVFPKNFSRFHRPQPEPGQATSIPPLFP